MPIKLSFRYADSRRDFRGGDFIVGCCLEHLCKGLQYLFLALRDFSLGCVGHTLLQLRLSLDAKESRASVQTVAGGFTFGC